MAKIRDILTYPAGVGGRRKLRTYVKMTLFVLGALIILLVVALFRQAQERRAMAVTKTVVVAPTETYTPQPTQTAVACPSDASEWTLVDIFPGDAYKRIEPVCVYDGLAHSVAWALAIHEGYSRRAAADTLGFDEFPMVQLGQVTIATNLEGPTAVDVYFVPPVPGFTEWYFVGDGEPAVSFAVRGCFRTSTVVGSERQDWGDGFPVVCELSMDIEATNMLMCLDELCYTSPYEPTRYLVLFGYSEGGLWVWLGNETDSSIRIDDRQAVQDDRNSITRLTGIIPWDAEWLLQTYQVEENLLPENWQTFTSEAELQTIVSAINVYLAGGENP